ncbi:MAG: Hsp70 family protein [Verrucomicrobiae bacterium]
MSSYLGIDLGTSNCAVARAAAESCPEILQITQAVSANGIGEKALLPSAVYLPAEGEFPEGTPALPWAKMPRGWVLGTFARDRGSLQPDRLIVSAKSWLCHPHVDRSGPVLPWASDAIAHKWSPLEVSRQLLEHLIEISKSAGDAPDAGHVVVTVPASFDETARGLTLEAAQLAGLGEVTLLEEPQAAFYAWLESQGPGWRKQARAGDLLLVCDVGGGTADFSLIAVTGRDGELSLERVAVGEHLLLGGDNMDLALAHAVSEKLAASGKPLDEWQFLALVQAVRSAKEALLSDPALAEAPLAIPSRSSKLIASTARTSLTRDEVADIAINGFFPICAPEEMPAMRRAGGIRESGLPYAADAAISKHLARFLTRAKANVSSSPHLLDVIGGAERIARSPLLIPDAVLFNGGVFNAAALRRRVLELLSQWAGDPVRELEGAQADHAVALGAAIYARLRATGNGLRIKSGTARSYYIGMEAASLAVPGRRPVTKALCVAPQGMEEGTSHAIVGQVFFLYTGEVSEFRFFHSEVRAGDRPGDLLPGVSELEESAHLEIAIPPPPGHEPGEEVPVSVETQVTELGHLELFFVHAPTGDRWKLEFHIRMQ